MSDSGVVINPWVVPDINAGDRAVSRAEVPQEIIDQARQEGLQKGYQEGYQAGMAEAQAVMSRMRDIATAMATPLSDLDHQVTEHLSLLAVEVARQIVRREVSVDRKIVNQAIEQGLKQLGKLEGQVQIFVNPKDLPVVQEALAVQPSGAHWRVVPEASMEAGGCAIKSGLSTVDFTIENQLKQLLQQLLGESAAQAGSGDTGANQ